MSYTKANADEWFDPNGDDPDVWSGMDADPYEEAEADREWDEYWAEVDAARLDWDYLDDDTGLDFSEDDGSGPDDDE